MSEPGWTFIGAGNMAGSLIGGLIASGASAENIAVVDISAEACQKLADKFGINVLESIDNIAPNSAVVIAVKPHIVKAVCTSLHANSPALVVSVAAGVRADSIANWLPDSTAIVRCMPNTPALLGLGATGLFTQKDLTDTKKNDIATIFSSIGISIWVNKETDIDTVTAVSGSGPAYFFRMIEAMQASAIELGLNAEDASKLITQTALGAAQMAKNSHISIQQLRENVTSKGGTTAAALTSLNNNAFDLIIKQAVTAARERSIELADS